MYTKCQLERQCKHQCERLCERQHKYECQSHRAR